MAHLEIPIPDDLDERQRADLTGWLTELARQQIAGRLPCEDDPEWHAEAVRRFKRGMADAQEGRVLSLEELKRRVNERHGFKL